MKTKILQSKILLTILFVCVLVLGFAGIGATTVYAAESGTCGENLTWTLDDNGVLTISGTGAMTDYTAKGSVPWTKNSVKTVVIESGVTSIGNFAFYECGSLTAVTIPNGVTSIGKYAFYGCKALTAVTIPEGVTSIEQYTFYGCEALTAVTIPGSVTSIESAAFHCLNLISATFEGTTAPTLGTNAFSYTSSGFAIYVPAGANGYDGDSWTRYTVIEPYTVAFEMNGHGTAPTAQIVNAGSTATQPTAPTAEGYIFGGWYTDADCTVQFDFATPITANTTLYARWISENLPPLTAPANLTWDGDTAKWDAVISAVGYLVQLYKGGIVQGYPVITTATEYSFTITESGSYTFKVTALGDGNSYKDSNEAESGASVFYAVTFEMNGHGTAPTDQIVNASSTATQPTTPTAKDYIFGGWYTDADCTAQFDFVTPITADTTLYAKWAKAYFIWVGNVRVTEDNAADILGNSTVSYNAATNTLTLNNATINTLNTDSELSKKDTSIVASMETLNIVYSGTSTLGGGIFIDNNEEVAAVTVTGRNAADSLMINDNGSSDAAFRVHGFLSVSGPGSVTAASTAGIGIWISAGDSTGGDLTVSGSTVTAKGNSAMAALLVEGEFTVNSVATVIAENSGTSLYGGVIAKSIDANNCVFTDGAGNTLNLVTIENDDVVGFSTSPTSGTDDLASYVKIHSHAFDEITHACSCGAIQVNEATFPDANFRTYVSDNFDTDGDGALSEEEIENITFIEINEDKNISSIKGVEYLNYLTNIDIQNNPQLTVVDLEFSADCIIQSINLSRNGITTLKLKSDWLANLECYANDITEIDLSGLPGLTYLICAGNKLTSLDVSNNTALQNLICMGNELTSLDVSNNTALTNLNCSENKLTSLDLSNNTALINLTCTDNELTHLDLTGMANLNDFSGDQTIIIYPDSENPVYTMPAGFDASKVTSATNVTFEGNVMRLDATATEFSYTYDTGIEGKTFTVNVHVHDYDPTTHTCACGAKTNGISHVSLTLGGDIGVNFYWVLADSVINDPEAYFLVKLPNGKTNTVLVSEITADNSYYKVTGLVAAKEMADDVTVELYSGGVVIASGNCSVRGYAERAFTLAESDPTAVEAGLITMIKAMLNYGAASQMLFGYNTGDLANSILAEGDTIVAEVTADKVTGAVLSGSVEGITPVSFSCVLESTTTIRHYFTVEGDIAGYTFKVGDTAVEPMLAADGKYYVDVTGISAKELGAAYVFTITNGAQTQTITASVQSYMKSVIAYGNETTKDTIYAMYAYGEAAEAYFAE